MEREISTRYKVAEEISSKLDLKLVKTSSNIHEEIRQSHALSHTYTSIFAVLCLQKLFSKYYYASTGLDYSTFSVFEHELTDCGRYELLSLNCFSTSNLRFYSSGGAKTRFEKTKEIASFSLAKNYLHVCLKKEVNCGSCPKCMRTLITLDALDKLDEFGKVFNISKYRKDKLGIAHWLITILCNGNKSAAMYFMALEIYKELIKKYPNLPDLQSISEKEKMVDSDDIVADDLGALIDIVVHNIQNRATRPCVLMHKATRELTEGKFSLLGKGYISNFSSYFDFSLTLGVGEILITGRYSLLDNKTVNLFHTNLTAVS